MNKTSKIRVRRAVQNDAATLLGLIDEMGTFFEGGPSGLTTADIERDGFGGDPWFMTWIAEIRGEAIGYAIAYRAYSTDDAPGPGLFLLDMFVVETARRIGVGRRLMSAVAAHSRAIGGRWVMWGVWTENRPAYRFYESLGGTTEVEVSPFLLDGNSFKKLADEA